MLSTRSERRAKNQGIKPKDIILFSRQMSTLQKAGVPILAALQGQKIRVVQGYPAASMHGIVLASGLDAKTFVVREVPSGVQVYMAHQPNNLQCRVLYQLPEGLNESATVTMQASRC